MISTQNGHVSDANSAMEKARLTFRPEAPIGLPRVYATGAKMKNGPPTEVGGPIKLLRPLTNPATNRHRR